MRATRILASALGVALAACAASASPLETLTLPTVGSPGALASNGPLGSTVNRVINVSPTTAGTVRSLHLTGTLVSTGAGSWPTEARIQVTPPNCAPAVTLIPFTATGVFTTVSTTDFTVYLPSPVAGNAGSWEIRFFESFDDGGTGVVDANWDNGLTIVLDDAGQAPATPPAVVTDLGILDTGMTTQTFDITDAGQVQWFKFTLDGPVCTGALRTFLDIDTEGSTVSGQDTMLGLYTASGTLLTSDDDDGTGFLSQLSFGQGSRLGPTGAANYDGRDGSLSPGVYYLAVSTYFASFGAGFNVVSDSTDTGGMVVNFNRGTQPVPGAPTAEDLGTLSVGTTTATYTLNPGEIKWYRFVVPNDVPGAARRYVDIDTEGSIIADTEIGVFSADVNGTLLANDDDSGSGLLSQLSFGQGTRCPTGTSAFYNGRNGALAAGVYYLAVAEYNATFASGYVVTTNGTGSSDITVHINFGSQPAPTPPSGILELGNLPDALTEQDVTVPAGGVKWVRFTLPEQVDIATRRFLDIDTEGTTSGSDTVLVLYQDTGAIVAGDNDSGSGVLSQLTWGQGYRPPVGDGFPYDGFNGTTLAAGTYLLAVGEAGTAFGGDFLICPGANPGNQVHVRLRKGIQPPAAIPTNTNLGTVGSTPISVNPALAENGVLWFKFTTTTSTDPTLYVDIDTEGSTLAPANDTTILLYTPTGDIYTNVAGQAFDADSGSGLLSQLTFGGESAPRPAVGDGLPYDGASGVLAAGEYYLAVCGAFPNAYINEFAVFGASIEVGNVTVNINSNLPGGGPVGCNLADICGIGGPPSVPDGLLTGDDFNAFISAFASSDLLADVTGIGGPPAIPDGLITGDDFNAFISAFAAGCP